MCKTIYCWWEIHLAAFKTGVLIYIWGWGNPFFISAKTDMVRMFEKGQINIGIPNRFYIFLILENVIRGGEHVMQPINTRTQVINTRRTVIKLKIVVRELGVLRYWHNLVQKITQEKSDIFTNILNHNRFSCKMLYAKLWILSTVSTIHSIKYY